MQPRLVGVTSNRSSANSDSSSPVGRSAMIWPSRMTAIRPASSCTIASWWVVSTIVLPSPAARWAIQSLTVRAASTSRPMVGSSSSRIGGSVISAAAIATFCCMPREYDPTVSLRRSHSPRPVSSRCARGLISVPLSPLSRPKYIRFCHAVSGQYTLRDPSSTAPICRTASARRRPTSWPPSRIVPAVGRISPQAILIVVVLPAPFGPSSPITCPCGTLSVMSFTAVSQPLPRRYRLVSPDSSIAGRPSGGASPRRPSTMGASFIVRPYGVSFVLR